MTQRDWLMTQTRPVMVDLKDTPIRRRNFGVGHAILEDVARTHGISVKELKSPSRYRNIAWPRQEAMWRLKRETTLSLPAIGRLLNRDHTTVLHGVLAHQRRLNETKEAEAA